MRIKEVQASKIKDSRNEDTIQISIKTDQGNFISSSPSGKSKGEHEEKYYLGSIDSDIKTIENLGWKLKKLDFHEFKDLKKVEYYFLGKIGSNSMFALEASILKAIAFDKNKEVWQIINPDARELPFPVGNCVGGGLHTKPVSGKKPDFQEFLVIPKSGKFLDNVFLMKKFHEKLGKELEIRKVRGDKNDENAWSTSLSNQEVLDVIKKVKEELGTELGKRIDIGLDVASSSFYTGMVYHYKNKLKRLTKEKQVEYILDLIDKYNLDYVEDPIDENDFLGFAKLKYGTVKVRPTCTIVGDDLTVSHIKRLKKALKTNSINAIIVKPNQVGSLIEISELIKLSKKYGIKTVFSHRSGETQDNILGDLAFGFSSDYIKTGVLGKEREAKLNRLIEIEKKLNL